MSRMCFSLMIVAAVWAGMSGAAYAQNTVTLSGSGSSAFETPPIASAGVATASCTIDRTSLQMACTARVHNIVGLTAGHIHVGGPGTAGPVVISIPNLPIGASDDFVLSWTWRESDITLRPAQGVLKMADFIEACSSGNCYLNFHTATNPGGEIRINLCPQGAVGRAANPFYSINVCEPAR
jgi:CHRD domain